MKPVFAKLQKRRAVSIFTLVCIFTMLTSIFSFGIDTYANYDDANSLSYSISKTEPIPDTGDFSAKNGNGLARENGKLYFYKNGKKCADGWIKSGKLMYYADSEGILATSTKKTIEGNEYIFDKSGIMFTDIFRFEGEAYYSGNDGVIRKDSWINFNGNKYLAKQDGTLYSNSVYNIGGNYYGFDIYGRLYTGSFTLGGKRYIAGSDGILKVSCWTTINGNKYYLKSDGSIASNETIEIDNIVYTFDKDGKSIPNDRWIESDDGYSYYLGKDGKLYKNGIFKIDNNLYAFDIKGRKLKGLFEINGNRYFSNDSGIIYQNNWNTINGKRYYSKEDGSLVSYGIHEIDSVDYAFDKDGATLSGLFTYNNELYIASETGEVLKNGVKKFNGKSYYASTDGHVFRNTLITFGPPKYFAKKDGSLACDETIEYYGRIYKFGKDCVIIVEEAPRENILEIAKNEIGTKIGKKYWESVFGSSYAYSNGDSTPWCACFVKWCFDKAGQGDRLKGVSNKAYVPSYTAWGNRNNLWTKNPSPGDIIIFRYSASSTGSHIGFVESVRGNTITTVEGNTGTSYHGEVKRNTYDINSWYIYGFIHY